MKDRDYEELKLPVITQFLQKDLKWPLVNYKTIYQDLKLWNIWYVTYRLGQLLIYGS